MRRVGGYAACGRGFGDGQTYANKAGGAVVVPAAQAHGSGAPVPARRPTFLVCALVVVAVTTALRVGAVVGGVA